MCLTKTVKYMNYKVNIGMSSDNTIKAGKMIGFRVSDDAMARSISFSLSNGKQDKVSEWVRECIRLRLSIERSGLTINDVMRPGFFNEKLELSNQKTVPDAEQSDCSSILSSEQFMHVVDKVHATYCLAQQIANELVMDPNFTGSGRSIDVVKHKRKEHVERLNNLYKDKG